MDFSLLRTKIVLLPFECKPIRTKPILYCLQRILGLIKSFLRHFINSPLRSLQWDIERPRISALLGPEVSYIYWAL
jgi:hypothetical protein